MEFPIIAERLQRAVHALQRLDIDAWISMGRETSILGEPALELLLPFQIMGRTVLAITKEGQSLCLVAPMEAEELQESGLYSEVLLYGSAAEFGSRLSELLLGLQGAKFALNFSSGDPSADGLSHSDFELLQRILQESGTTPELVSAASLLKAVRGEKSAAEVACIQRTVEAAMAVYEEARLKMKQGMSGREVQALFQGIIDREGYGYSWQKEGNPYVSVGTRSSYLCKRPPKDVRIEPGDVINVDLGLRIEGYASDNQRTFYALRPGETEPPEEVQHAWRTLQRINLAVAAAMITGSNSDDLTAIGNAIMLGAGFAQGYKGSYGHELCFYAHHGGIKAGLSLHQPDLDKTLLENMTFTLEPSIITSCGRVCQEEVVCVTSTGGRMLSKPQQAIWLIAT